MEFRFSKGFTLAELLVVVGILAIMGAVSFASMASFASKATGESLTSRVGNSLADLDRSIRDGTNGTYEATFATGSSGFYAVTEFGSASASGTVRSIDWGSGAIFVDFNSPTAGNWTVKTLYDSKISSMASFSGSRANVEIPLRNPNAQLDSGRRDVVSIVPVFAMATANRISVHTFDRDNLLTGQPLEKKVILSDIIVSGSSATASLKIRNVGDKKEFLIGSVPVGAVTLVFSVGGREFNVELRK